MNKYVEKKAKRISGCAQGVIIKPIQTAGCLHQHMPCESTLAFAMQNQQPLQTFDWQETLHKLYL
jgi:hypothetical protein